MKRRRVTVYSARPRPRKPKPVPLRFIRIFQAGTFFNHYLYLPEDDTGEEWVAWFTKARGLGKGYQTGSVHGLSIANKRGERLTIIEPKHYHKEIAPLLTQYIEEDLLDVGAPIRSSEWSSVLSDYFGLKIR